MVTENCDDLNFRSTLMSIQDLINAYKFFSSKNSYNNLNHTIFLLFSHRYYILNSKCLDI